MLLDENQWSLSANRQSMHTHTHVYMYKTYMSKEVVGTV